MLKRLVAGTKALLIILLLFSSACSREDDVVKIQALIKKGGALVEKHDIQGLLALTSGDFVALPGPHDRQETKGILQMAFRHYGPFRVLHPQPGIDLDPAKQSALGTVYFMIVKKDLSYPGLEELYTDPTAWLAKAGENADLYRLTPAELKKPKEIGSSSALGRTPSRDSDLKAGRVTVHPELNYKFGGQIPSRLTRVSITVDDIPKRLHNAGEIPDKTASGSFAKYCNKSEFANFIKARSKSLANSEEETNNRPANSLACHSKLLYSFSGILRIKSCHSDGESKSNWL